MKGILHSICIGSLALALTAWGQQANDTTTVKAKAKKQAAVSAQTTTSAKTGAKTSGSMAGTRSHRRANVSAQTSSSATVDRNRMRNTSVNARNEAMVNRQRERNIAMTERVKKQENVNVRNKTNVHVNVNDRTRFTNVTRVTSNGRIFDRAVFRINDRRLHLGFHDRIFFINNFSEVVVINGCSFFLDDGIFWPAFIIGENCVHPRNVAFVAVD